ncbi:MAG: RNase adapter RapZ [Alphaproteobacteria bacterium]|nr:RNase adapter RapZ [Alphaproteobacteria bacterium]MBU0797411.1 RNase adapter RapZ [Alphaproteobacteria bacterium]MBU0888530.1 RNase adapter RapZ [Alphaproteobacteria bacterium]MBU1813736.1 RNase adapter RapZ [Alphaproteobacteria bacterium]MBU2091974.1 RNase adapter RapZ [Alphaproteobacteria bacterium]
MTDMTPAPASASLATLSDRIVLVTGLSGAGRTACLKALEDIGYEAIDNLPIGLLRLLIDGGCSGPGGRPRPIAIGVDIRTRDFEVERVTALIDQLRADSGPEIRLLFLDCDTEVLARRFTETRRRHPLAADRPVIDGIELERQRIAPLRERADQVIDTTDLAPGDLRRRLWAEYALDPRQGVTITVLSFSYREGLPREADLVFDVRFLDNPHYDPALRPLDGRDAAVAAHIEGDSGLQPFFGHLTAMLGPLLPRYYQEGKSYLTIAIGCTGGRHRSVYVAERLAVWLEQQGQRVIVSHRDVERWESRQKSGI